MSAIVLMAASEGAPGGLSPEETLDRRTLLISGLSSAESEASRSRQLGVFFDYGAQVRWFGTECMLAFPTERQTINAIEAAAKSRGVMRTSRISELEADRRSSYYRLAAEMHEELKPERDSRVANRLIGAALGIKMPKKKESAPVVEKPKAPVVDAWDD